MTFAAYALVAKQQRWMSMLSIHSMYHWLWRLDTTYRTYKNVASQGSW